MDCCYRAAMSLPVTSAIQSAVRSRLAAMNVVQLQCLILSSCNAWSRPAAMYDLVQLSRLPRLAALCPDLGCLLARGQQDASPPPASLPPVAALYVFLYSVHYFFMKTKMTGFFQTAFYFGYTLMFCLGETLWAVLAPGEGRGGRGSGGRIWSVPCCMHGCGK
jgi:hypothetical protein